MAAAREEERREQLVADQVVGNGYYVFEISSRLRDADNWEVVARIPLEVVLNVKEQEASR